MEEYIGLLRQRRAVVRNRGIEADEQIGIALDELHQHGITEQALSDYEPDDEESGDDFLNDRFYPPSSDRIYSDNGISDSYASSCNSYSEFRASSAITSVQPDEPVLKLPHSA